MTPPLDTSFLHASATPVVAIPAAESVTVTASVKNPVEEKMAIQPEISTEVKETSLTNNYSSQVSLLDMLDDDEDEEIIEQG
jgi:hypothetical protein